MSFDHRAGHVGSGGSVEGRAPGSAAPGKQSLTQQMVQLKADGAAGAGGGAIQEQAQQGVAGPGGALPHADAIQRSFGPAHDVSGIKAHVGGAAGDAAKGMGAHGYATGDSVAFQRAPDLHLAAHEAAHVVQQRAGVSLKSAVGEAGDSYEQNADAVADRVVAGQPAHDLLPGGSGGAGQHQAVQRKDEAKPKEITDKQIQAAQAWVTSSKVGPETIKEVQGVSGVAKSGVYDEATIRAVYAKQQALKMTADGQAGETFCQRTGLIFTHTITAATVADKELDAIKAQFPGGVTVAIYPDFEDSVTGKAEFKLQAGIFAKNQQAVGVSGGAVALGVPCAIKVAGDVVEVVQSIHRGLLQKWTDSLKASGNANPNPTGEAGPPTPPDYLKVKNLALFCHGESWGMGMNAKNDFSGGGLHNNTTRGMNPSNVEAFVRGLSDAVVPAVRVQLFACNTGANKDRKDEWTAHKQGEKDGGDSFASSLAQGFGPEATVSAHTTAGHTTENFAARVFGKEAGGGAEGMSLFDNMYPESYVQAELTRLFAAKTDEERTALHDSLREQMWSHFKDSITGETQRAKKRYTVPMGQECFANPDNARTLLHADFQTNWISDKAHLDKVKPAAAKKK